MALEHVSKPVGRVVEALAPRFDIPTVAAMVVYPLDPGHSDLDNEQPMSVRVGFGPTKRDVPCTLGDIREAQRCAGHVAGRNGYLERQAESAGKALALAQLQASSLLLALKRVTTELELVARAAGSAELALVADVGRSAIAMMEGRA